MELKRLFLEDDAVSSTIGVVMMVAVTVILAAAVGMFALGLTENSANKMPSASIETEWGTTTISGTTYTTVDITMLGGDAVQAKYVTVQLEGAIVWNDNSGAGAGGLATYDSKTWSLDKIKSGDTLGLREDSTTISTGDKIEVVWNNGDRSQILGSGTAD